LPANNELSGSQHHIINIFAIQMHRFWNENQSSNVLKNKGD